ncbi:uncharacterized protein MYCGRDRAFT_96101 [Zymoseptoria tritici IPO323]|uniref:Hydrophobin n=1 Tax=Zymoseptoria tritici (strain CBS 115943 / IPO323) TaxID=336722 RepID=F9XLA7_ZYMTI|nr:uncharacterized protein MYCGRDRAFT_96101 [Zymoseptoria tritici IPO323]EGP83773.1 hypothetical protein MYCGRDRAFT_96101 [Zymoseptoria tritici IPO323]
MQFFNYATTLLVALCAVAAQAQDCSCLCPGDLCACSVMLIEHRFQTTVSPPALVRDVSSLGLVLKFRCHSIPGSHSISAGNPSSSLPDVGRGENFLDCADKVAMAFIPPVVLLLIKTPVSVRFDLGRSGCLK